MTCLRMRLREGIEWSCKIPLTTPSASSLNTSKIRCAVKGWYRADGLLFAIIAKQISYRCGGSAGLVRVFSHRTGLPISVFYWAKNACSKKQHLLQSARTLKLWWAKQKSFKKKAISEKIGHKIHCSTKDALKNTLPFMQIAFKKNKEFREKFCEELDLSNEEIEWMKK